MTNSEIENLIKTIPYQEEEDTRKLFLKSKDFRKRGYLAKTELIDILRWKSRRNIHGHANSEEEINEITKLAFSASTDDLKIHILTAIKGVCVPSASAILMFYNPNIYPVIDKRNWKTLHGYEFVKTNEEGVNLTLSQWNIYLKLIRKWAKDLKMTAREVEKRLYDDKSIKIKSI